MVGYDAASVEIVFTCAALSPLSSALLKQVKAMTFMSPIVSLLKSGQHYALTLNVVNLAAIFVLSNELRHRYT